MRFDEEDVRPMGRPAYGVRGMDLEKGDYIVGMAVTPKPGKAPVAPSAQQKVEEAAKGNGKAENSKAGNGKGEG
ncbi:MAG TPA: DNA gyrase C-terminal beta-propeller domain-containing protein, partial [Terriglobales bacterium]|nr:DNA gyrase C-terminal beta-propeller domain-containing protein [Terriglobales bacterium]